MQWRGSWHGPELWRCPPEYQWLHVPLRAYSQRRAFCSRLAAGCGRRMRNVLVMRLKKDGGCGSSGMWGVLRRRVNIQIASAIVTLFTFSSPNIYLQSLPSRNNQAFDSIFTTRMGLPSQWHSWSVLTSNSTQVIEWLLLHHTSKVDGYCHWKYTHLRLIILGHSK